jgi:DNA-binding PadR family transcriptional regulator
MHQDKINKLTLLLLYLNSWEEKEYGELNHRAWKGHDFGTLDKLEEEGFITKTKTAKSLYLTEDGIEEAKRLERLVVSVMDCK